MTFKLFLIEFCKITSIPSWVHPVLLCCCSLWKIILKLNCNPKHTNSPKRPECHQKQKSDRMRCSPTGFGCAGPCQSDTAHGWNRGRGAARAGRCYGRDNPDGPETLPGHNQGDRHRSNTCIHTIRKKKGKKRKMYCYHPLQSKANYLNETIIRFYKQNVFF